MKHFLILFLALTLVLLSACQRSTPEALLSSTPTVSFEDNISTPVADAEPIDSSSESAAESAESEESAESAESSKPVNSSKPIGFSQKSVSSKEQSGVSSANVVSNHQVSLDIRHDIVDYQEPSDPFLTSVLNFCCNASSEILSLNKANTVFCPMSVYYPFALLTTAADGNTRQELSVALGIEEMSDEEIAQQCARLYGQTRQDTNDYAFLVANSLWCRKDLQISPDFARTAAKQFYASIHSIDFTDPLDIQQIQQWVYDNTKGLINPQIQPTADSALFLCNTIYLKGRWSEEFNFFTTREFKTETGETLSNQLFMRDTRYGGYYEGENYTRGDISISGIGTMSFFLPKEGIALKNLLSADQIKAMLLRDTENCEIAFTIPKVDIESKVDLIGAMKALGVEDAFDDSSAEFPLFVNQRDPAYIQKATQEAHLVWDENGIEAAAYTEIDVAVGAAPPNGQSKPQPKEITLDRPFLFVLHSEEGILFAGTCYRPN